MTFQEAEKTYKDLRSQHASGKLSDADFEAQVNQLKVQDAQGRWWQLGVRTGEWYVNDGQKWVKAKPPSATQPPTMPTSSPEDQEPPTVEKAERPSVLPRGLFAAKPESHNGNGLPRPLLIGIIAAVAIVVLGLLIGGYFVFGGSSLFGGASARATLTPTQIALLPPPSASQTPASTETPTPTATSVVTATSTVANPPTPSRPTGPTATRRPATATPTKGAAGPTATTAPPPGVYVTKLTAENISTDENKFQFVFRITFVNTTGGNWHNPSENGWVIYIWQVNNQGGNPYSQTRIIKDMDIPTGTHLVSLADPWPVGPSGAPDCNYVAGVYYLDNNMQRVPFLQPDGKQFRVSFSACK